MDPNHYHPYPNPYYRAMHPEPPPSAVQSRILELRKEKSRDAARSRRGKENHEFYELAKMLPLPAAITGQLGIMNKASIIRLTISYLKLRDFSLKGNPSWNPFLQLKPNRPNNGYETHQGAHILQTLEGFVFALGQDGRFLYISETVSAYLGLSQVEMTGSSIFDYTHQQDHAELAEHLGLQPLSSSSSSSNSGPLVSHNGSVLGQSGINGGSPLPPSSVCSNGSSESDGFGAAFNGSQLQMNGPDDTLERQFCIRMKSTLTKRGCQHFKSNGYRVVHVVAHLRPEMRSRRPDGTIDSNKPLKLLGLVAVANALPAPSVNEFRLEPDMFVTRLSLDLRILHCEPKVSELLDYTSDDLCNRSMYSLVHGQDTLQLRKWHLDLIHKGQVMSRYYRMMNKKGGYSWVQSCATLILSSQPSNGSNGPPPPSTPTIPCVNGDTVIGNNSGGNNTPVEEPTEQSIICINYVISAMEQEEKVIDLSQMPGYQNQHHNMPIKMLKGSLPLLHSPPSPPSSQPPAKKLQHCQLKRSNEHNSNSPLLGDEDSPQSNVLSLTSVPSTNELMRNSPNNGSNNKLNSSSADLKRRRCATSPVRPWKTPSPTACLEQQHSQSNSITSNNRLNNSLHSLNSSNSSGLGNDNNLTLIGSCNNSAAFLHLNGDTQSPPTLVANVPTTNSAINSNHSSNSYNGTSSSLLRHISVIRENNPAVLKPQANYPSLAAAAQASGAVYSSNSAAAAAAAAAAASAAPLHSLNGYQLALQHQLSAAAAHHHVVHHPVHHSTHPSHHSHHSHQQNLSPNSASHVAAAAAAAAATAHSAINNGVIATTMTSHSSHQPQAAHHPTHHSHHQHHQLPHSAVASPHLLQAGAHPTTATAHPPTHSMHAIHSMHSMHTVDSTSSTHQPVTFNQLNQLHLVDPYSAYTPSAAAAAAAAALHHHWTAYN